MPLVREKQSEKWYHAHVDIVKNLKDYRLSHEQKIFAGFLKESISAYTCNEKITNKKYMKEYFAADNDFLIYSTAIADPKRLIWKKVV